MIRPASLAVLAVFAALSVARAEPYGLAEPVPGQAQAAFLDLLRTVIPDLTDAGTAEAPLRLPYIARDESDEDPQTEASFSLSGLQSVRIRSEGREVTLVLADLGQADGWVSHVELLAAFDENLRLLDAINVGQDQTTGIAGAPIPISPADDAILTYSEHTNSSQTYGAYGLVMLKDGRFQVIDTVSTLGDRSCGRQRTQELTATAPVDGPGYAPVTLTVNDVQSVLDEDCDEERAPPAFEKAYSVTYTWSASLGGYVADSDDFAELNLENQDRY